METAFAALRLSCPEDTPSKDDWQEAEFVFNRLFVGPAALEAPPYASAYLDPETRVMGQTTLEIRRIFAALGLESPWKNIVPDDHISLELDGALALEHAQEVSSSSELDALQQQFLDHLKAWMPQFIERVKTAPSSHPAITYAADCLSSWLKSQEEAFAIQRAQ